MRQVVLALALLWLPLSALALPTGSAFEAVPGRFQNFYLSAGSRALGETCYSRFAMPDGSICNPALLPYTDESHLLGRAFIGNGYTAVTTANQLIFQPITKDTLVDLFQHDTVTSVEANAGLLFWTRYFSAEFAPYRVQYVSEVHNPNLPVVSVNGEVERALIFSGGLPLSLADPRLDAFSLGLRLKILQRRYVHGTFSLLDATTEPPEQVLPVKEQYAVIAEPSVAWHGGTGPWKLIATVAGSGIGPASPYDTVYDDPADLTAALGVQRKLGIGTLNVGVDLVNLTRDQDPGTKVRLGISYQFGILETMLGFNTDAYNVGLEFNAKLISIGIVYEFLRNDFGTGTAENRISTEFAVKL